MLVGSHDADVDTKNAKGDTALMKAVIWDKQQIVDLLLAEVRPASRKSRAKTNHASVFWGCFGEGHGCFGLFLARC